MTMNILYLTLSNITTAYDHNIYMDLLDEFIRKGHTVTIVSPCEKKYGKPTHTLTKPNMTVLRVRTGNLFQVGMIRKGISQVLLSWQYARAIRKYCGDTKFDLILYSTPPITLAGVVKREKKRNKAKTYLLLKDIFPQNAIDIGVLRTRGIKGIIYRRFRKQEKALYHISDRIGCMSPANVNYVRIHNPEVEPTKVEECPNSVVPTDQSLGVQEKRKVREKYGLPVDKTLFVYGGNLGRPQDIPFIIKCLQNVADVAEAHFLIVGGGTEYGKLQAYAEVTKQRNFTLMSQLPKEEYDRLAAAGDVGMLFLDHRFTIPNFPSRMLSYMQAKLPIYAVTDEASDAGEIAEKADFGWRSSSADEKAFAKKVKTICACERLVQMGGNAWEYLNQHYDVKRGYDIIMSLFETNQKETD